MAMTWKEFKEYVDRKLSEAGRDDGVEIWYIDISYPGKETEYNCPEVHVDDDGLSVS